MQRAHPHPPPTADKGIKQRCPLNASGVRKIADSLALFSYNREFCGVFGSGQKIGTISGTTRLSSSSSSSCSSSSSSSSMDVLADRPSSFFLTSIRRSSFRPLSSLRPSTSHPRTSLHPRPLSRTDNDVHYFLLLQRAQGNGGSRGGYRGCSLALRRIIRCRYAITTFASAKWKRFRFFAPSHQTVDDSVFLSQQSRSLGVAGRRWRGGEARGWERQ